MADESGPFLAKPSGACCLAGTIHQGDPRGSFTTIAEIETYISRPLGERWNGNVVLYFPDVYGFFTNGLLIMDGFAEAGYLTLGVDYFRGDYVWKHRKDPNDKATTEPGFDFEVWKDKHIVSAREIVPKWVKAVTEQYAMPKTKFACVGYCFGAPFVCDELAGGVCLVGAFAHPAFLKEHHFFNLKTPLFLSCAENDHTFSTESRNRAVEILQNEKKSYQLQLFSGVEHGFALRGNMDNPYERYVKEQSLKSIAEYFDFWLSQ